MPASVGRKEKANIKGLESIPTCKELINKEELGRRLRIDKRSKRKIWIVVTETE